MQDPLYDPSTVARRRGQRGTLEQLPDGRWRARYREGGRSSKRPQKISDTRAEGAAWLRERLEELEAAFEQDPAAAVRRREAERMVSEACRDYLAAHEAAPPTIEKLRRQLRQFEYAFGERTLRSLEGQGYELQAWRKTLSPGSQHDVFRAVNQLLAQAVRWNWLDSNPAAAVKNPKRKRPEVKPPPWEHVELIAGEIDERYEAVPIFLAGSGLRIEEWAALERPELDAAERIVRVRRAYSSGRLIELGADGSKTRRQRRNVPLRRVVLAALASMPVRLDSPLLWPAPRGGHLDTDRWRERYWEPAVRAAGVPYFPPKDLRHVYASESIAADVDLFTLSRRMGTSLKEIDETYGHLVHDAVERELGLLDDFDARQGRIAEQG
jgi:integrase